MKKKFPVCIDGICKGCFLREAKACEQKEPEIYKMLRKEGLLEEYVKSKR
jgi:ATP-dependent phosphoenolpyruvate carboxykinase